MAKVLNPFMSTDAKGTTSGMTARGWRGLRVMTRKSQPVRRIRTLQPANRAQLGFLARAWAGLTEANRVNWRNWAQNHPQPDGFGGTFQMSGINAFIQLNQVRMRSAAAVALAANPPVSDLAVGMATLTVAQGVGAGTVKCDWTLNGTGLVTDWAEVWMAGPFESGGKISILGKLARVGVVTGTTLTLQVANLMAGKWYWAGVRYIGSDGQVASFLYGQSIAKT